MKNIKYQINKIAALCIRNKKLLVVRKNNIYITLGGKIEQGETELECLSREVREEIGCEIKNPINFTTFYDNSYKGGLQIICYFCELTGEIKLNPKDSTDNFCWITRNYQQNCIPLAPVLEHQIIPKLIERRLL